MFSISFVNGLGKSLMFAGVGFSLVDMVAMTSVSSHDTAELESIREATMAYQDVAEAESPGLRTTGGQGRDHVH